MGKPQEEKWWIKPKKAIQRWFIDHGFHAGTIIGTVAMAWFAIWVDNEHGLKVAVKSKSGKALLISFAVWAFCAYFNAQQQKRITAIEQELAESNNLLGQANRSKQELERKIAEVIEQAQKDFFVLFKDLLRDSATDVLELGNDDRISVFKHTNGVFYRLGRYSINPEYDREGRGTYPADQGVIHDAWRDGEVYVENIQPYGKTDASKRRYCNEMKDKWNIDEATARGFTMKSRCIWAYRIRDRADRENIAVVVLESMRPNRWKPDEIRVVMQTEKKHIISFLERHKSPDLSLPAREGIS